MKEFCSFHKDDCEEIKMITIIELKKGKIIQTKICEECFSKRINEASLINNIPNDPEAILDLFLNEKSYDQECIECNTLNLNKDLSKEQKIKLLQTRMTEAIRVEDYESAALIKKEIKKLE